MCMTNVTGVTNYGARVYYKNPDIKDNIMIEFENPYQDQMVKERFKGSSKLYSRFKKRISGKGIILGEREMKHIEDCINKFYKINGIGYTRRKKFEGENYLMPESEYIFDSKKIFTLVDTNGIISMSAGLDPEDASTVNVDLTIKSEGRLKKFTSFIDLDRSQDITKDYFTQLLKIHFRNLEKDSGLEQDGRFTHLIEDSAKNFKESLERKIELFCELFKYSNDFIKRVQIRRAYEKIPVGHYSDALLFVVKVFFGDDRTEESLVIFKRERGSVLLGDMFNEFMTSRCYTQKVYKNDLLANKWFLKGYSYALGDTEPDSESTFYVDKNELNFASNSKDRSEGLVGYCINQLLRKDLSKVENHSTIVNSILKNTYGHIYLNVYLNKDVDEVSLMNLFMNRSITKFAKRFSEVSINPENGEELLFENYGDVLEADLLNALELPIQRVDPGFLNQTLTSKKDIWEAFKNFPEEAKSYIENATVVRTSLLTDTLDYSSRSEFRKENYTRLYKYKLLVEIMDNLGNKREIYITFENHVYPLVKEVRLINYGTDESLDLDVRDYQRTLLKDSNLISKYMRNLLLYRHKIIRLLVLAKFNYKIVLYKRDGLLHMDRAIITNHEDIDNELKNVLQLNTKEENNDKL